MQVTDIKLTNLGTVNKNKVTLFYADNKGNEKRLVLYFSYETIIAIGRDYPLKVTAERFSNTTSKFQAELEPDKSRRIEPETFKKELGTLFK